MAAQEEVAVPGSPPPGTYAGVCKQVVFVLSDKELSNPKNKDIRNAVLLAKSGWLDVASTIAMFPAIDKSLKNLEKKSGRALDLPTFSRDLASCKELEALHGRVRRRVPYQPADSPGGLDAKFHAAKFGGVLVVGGSAQYGSQVITVLLGGRHYTGQSKLKGELVYEYCDFGGAIEKAEQAKGEHHIAAFREFLEELFALEGQEAGRVAEALWEDTRASLVGGEPILHGGRYLLFILPAEAIVKSPQLAGRLPEAPEEGASAIELLMASGKRSSELTSLALVSLEELIRGAVSDDGSVSPLSVRSLDDGDRPLESSIKLRGAARGNDCMVGVEGSVASCATLLRGFAQPYLEAVGANAASHGGPSGDRLPLIFDMEMGDPDDVLTLLFICANPRIELKAVTITPGFREQVALARWILSEVGLLEQVRIGAQDWPERFEEEGGPSQDAGWYANFQRLETTREDCEPASRVLCECCDGATTLVTGAALHNLGAALKLDGFRLGRLVAQGGFAGEGVVPAQLQMEEFKGMKFCSTWNFGGNIPAAESALSSPAIARRVCVSKNVCHRTAYDSTWHEAVAEAVGRAHAARDRPRARALEIMNQSMEYYLSWKPEGKKIHDPLALAVAIEESVCTLREVALECNKESGKKWGARLAAGSATWISIDYDEAKFKATLLDTEASRVTDDAA